MTPKLGSNLVSTSITEEDFTALKQKIGELEAKVSEWAIELHLENKSALAVLGDRSLPFTEHTLMMASERKEFVPQYVDIEEFKKDLELFKKCQELLKLIEIVHERVRDTFMASGSDAFAAARKIYYYVKGLVKIQAPGANVIFDEMKKRYKRIGEKEETNETNTNAVKKVTAAKPVEADSEDASKNAIDR